jgi:hypothetical protein
MPAFSFFKEKLFRRLKVGIDHLNGCKAFFKAIRDRSVPMNLIDYAGVIHFHSKYSYDGYSPIPSIIKDAEKCGIDFLMLTDHDHLKAKEDGWEGWHGETLLIVGQEVSPRYNHFLAFNIPAPISFSEDKEGRCPQKYIDDIKKKSGIGFIAHPDHEGAPMFHVKQYCWNDWNVSGYDGISIWDFMTDWQKSLSGYLRSLLSFLAPAYFLKGPRSVTLERWDRLNAIKKTVGIGELDNHASTKKLLIFSFSAFPFKKAFRFIRTHILTDKPFCGDARQDIDLVYRTLLSGRCYVALEYFRPSKGFSFHIMDHRRETFSMGDSLQVTGSGLLSVALPFSGRIHVIRNGRIWKTATGKEFQSSIDEPGVYRVEVFLKSAWKYRPWIFSNPIFVDR